MSQNDSSVSSDRGSMGALDRHSSSTKVVGVLMILLVMGFLTWQLMNSRKGEIDRESRNNARIDTPEVKGMDLDPLPEPETPEIITLGQIQAQQPAVVDTSIRDRKMQGFSRTMNSSINTGETTPGGTPFSAPTDETHSTEYSGITGSQPSITQNSRTQEYDGQGVAKAVASRIGNRSLILTQGAKIPCTLETALDSSVPGMTSCIVSQDVYSSDGLVRLIDRGSKLNGRYDSEMNIGQIRIGIVWNRLETPEGVIVDLGSDSIDTLGRAGASGWVDKRFWERFGHAIMFSLVSDGFQYINNRRSASNNPNYLEDTEKSTQDMAQLALETEINLKPILRKNQGDPIMIFLNKDLSFEDVYELKLGHHPEHPFKDQYYDYQRK